MQCELLEVPGALSVLSLEVAARQAASATRTTYASVYRTFTATSSRPNSSDT